MTSGSVSQILILMKHHALGERIRAEYGRVRTGLGVLIHGPKGGTFDFNSIIILENQCHGDYLAKIKLHSIF